MSEQPGSIVALDDGYDLVWYRDPETGQRLADDPPPSTIQLMVTLPANRCFDRRDPWLEFTGTEVIEISSPFNSDLWVFAASVGSVAATCILVGTVVDARTRRRRDSALNTEPHP